MIIAENTKLRAKNDILRKDRLENSERLGQQKQRIRELEDDVETLRITVKDLEARNRTLEGQPRSSHSASSPVKRSRTPATRRSQHVSSSDSEEKKPPLLAGDEPSDAIKLRQRQAPGHTLKMEASCWIRKGHYEVWRHGDASRILKYGLPEADLYEPPLYALQVSTQL